MQVIVRAINGLLVEFSILDEADFSPTLALFKDGIKRYAGGLLGVQYETHQTERYVDKLDRECKSAG